MKYDAQIGELKTKLDSASSVLIVLPNQVNIDKLAASLALYLSLKQSGKSASIVSESQLKVSQAALFGIGDVKSQLPDGSGGNLTLVMEGVVEGGKVPALEKLDWYPDGNNLNLVFHVNPGKKFEPINITPRFEKASFQLIFFIGAPVLGDFGLIYSSNIEKLGDATKVSIDNSQNNNLFSNINIIDSSTASVSEMVAQVLQGLGLSQDAEISSNIITGIYDATNNLTNNVSGDTFIVVGQAMQMGGKVPFIQAQINQGGFDIRQFGKSVDRQVSESSEPAQSVIQPTSEPDVRSANQPIADSGVQIGPLTDPTDKTDTPTSADPAETPVVESPPALEQTAKSQYEVPTGEQVSSGSPENTNPAPDWLTPKIFKGGGLG